MHVDLDAAVAGAEFARARVCVVGGGIAGLILARRLGQAGVTVTLLEAGGLELEERSQALFAAEMAAETHLGTGSGRFRTFGGSSTRWGGQLLPFAAETFSPPAGSGGVPWPIREEELTPYYEEILEIFAAAGLPFDGAEVQRAMGVTPVELGPELQVRYSKWAPFAKRNLAGTVGKDCLEDARVTIYTHANVAELLGAPGKVTAARVLDYARREFQFAADVFVVCSGTVESSRLLLASAGAVPDAAGQVGRYFHDHVSLTAAVVPVRARASVLERLGPFLVNGVLHTCKLEATCALEKQAGLGAVMAHFTVEEPEDSGIAAVKNVVGSLQKGQLGEALGKNLVPMLRGLGDVARLVWEMKVRKRRAVSRRAVMRLKIDMEQAGVAENRVRLSDARDALGLSKVVVDWRVGDGEYATAKGFAPVVRARLEAAGFGGFVWEPWVEGGAKVVMEDTYHPMGGLRMGVDPAASVVGPDLRVHGVENLYVASCAVYPSGGSSNPTFTLMALTLRLGDLLVGELGGGGSHSSR